MELPGASGLQSCLQAIREAFPALRVTTASPIEEGWDNYILEINESLIFRFPRRPDILRKLATDVRLLSELAKTLPLHIPDLTFVARQGQGGNPSFVGYPKIPGKPLSLQNVDNQGQRRVAQQLGEFLTKLHRFPPAEAVALGVSDGSAESWHGEHEDLYARVKRDILPLLGPSERIRIAKFWESFLQNTSNFAFNPVLVHRDLTADNVLWDPVNSKVTGVIDWGDATIGDPAIDFASEFHVNNSSFTKMMLTAYKGTIDPGFLRRADFYSREAPVHEVLFGLETGKEKLVKRGLEALAKTTSDV